MAHRQHRPALLVALVAVLVATFAAAPATHAYDEVEAPSENPPVSSDGTRLHVRLERRGGQDHVIVTDAGGGSSGDSTSECAYRLVSIPEAARALALAGQPPTPDSMPYMLYCGTAFIRALWITPADVVDYDLIARTEAQRYVDTVLAPGLAMRFTPPNHAVTGVAANFWIDGWDGTPIAVPTIAPFGPALDITLTLAHASWDFGDTTAATRGDLGRAHPATSTVRHNYTHRSTSRDAPDQPYLATATVTIGATYRIDGGPVITVDPPLTATTSSPVVVRELQAVLG